MNPVISVLVPTWGRPARLRQMMDSVLATAAQPEAVEILVRVSLDDPKLYGYHAVQQCGEHFFGIGGADTYGQGIEWLRRKAVGDILCAASDDVLFRTTGWDELVRAAFAAVPDGLLVAYANDGRGREKCEHFFTTRRWIDAVGYMVWPEFRHFCVDQWVEELARDLGPGRLVFLRDVVIEHLHKKYAKAPDDATYRMVRGETRTSEQDNALYAKRSGERGAALERLRAAIG